MTLFLTDQPYSWTFFYAMQVTSCLQTFNCNLRQKNIILIPFGLLFFPFLFQLMFAYMGISYLMSVFGGWLGDCVLGQLLCSDPFGPVLLSFSFVIFNHLIDQSINHSNPQSLIRSINQSLIRSIKPSINQSNPQ